MFQIPNKKNHNLADKLRLLVLHLSTIMFLMIILPGQVSAAEEVTDRSEWCCIHGVGVGPCINKKKETFVFDDRVEAKSQCDTWSFAHTDPDVECNSSVVEPFHESANREWPRCDLVVGGGGLSCGSIDPQPITNGLTCDSSTKHTGVFYYNSCPDIPGILKDSQRGCVQEDEPKQCKITAGNPVNTATGSKYHTERIDLGYDTLELSLEYTSNLAITNYGKKDFNTIAPGWNYSYRFEISAVKKAHGVEYVKVKRPNGRNIRYEYDETSQLWKTKLASDGKLLSLTDGWEFITEDGIEYYDLPSSGYGKSRITQKVLYSGPTLSFQYSSGLISKVIDEFGNFIFFKVMSTTNIGYRIHYVEHSDGRKWLIGYHPTTANMQTITYPDSTVKQFHYEDLSHPHALTGITDRRGVRYATYQYDADRRVIKEWHHAKDLNDTDINVEELTIEYDPVGHPSGTRLITNSRGEVSTYEVEQNNGIWQIKSITGPGCSSCANDNTTFTYDTITNDLLSKVQDGVTTTYGGYDEKGQYAYKIEADEVGVGADERRTDFTYDSRFIGKITSITEDSVYGSNDKVTNYVYDANGQMTSMTVNGFKPNGTAISKTTSYEYNGPFNQISRINGPRAGNIDETVFDYYGDTVSPVENINRLEKVTGSAGIVKRDNIQWSTTGKVISEDRPNGMTINNVYDTDNDRLETSTHNDGVKSIVTQFNYLATGHIESVTRNFGTREASTLTLTYDDALRVTRVTDEVGNYVEYDLDTEGNQLGEMTRDPNGVLKKQITQIFDAYDFVDSMTQSGVEVEYDYGTNGVLNTQTNGNDIVTEYSYDSLKRLTQINQDYQGTNPNTANSATGFTYDAGERVETVTDARGNTTTYNYDDFGNLISLVSPDTGTTSYVYDLTGNMTQKTDAKNITVNMTYDGRNRITAIDYADNTLDTTFFYDQGVNATGKLSSFSDQTGNTTFTYDGYGNQLSKAQVITGFNALMYSGFNNLTTSYSYDLYNRLTAMTYPSGVTLNYEYDDLNQVNKITTSIDGQAETVVDMVTYLPFGPINSINFGNGKNYNANFDDGYRLIDYNFSVDVSAVYAYDNNHNITAITREVSTNNDGFSYDDLDRLTYDLTEGPTVFTYDKLGNRTSIQIGSQPTIPYTIDGSSNKLLNVGSNKPRSYDANGNTIEPKDVGSFSLIYNQANRMAKVETKAGTQGEYAHNAIGQRVHKTQYQSTGYFEGDYLFIYDEQGQLIYTAKFGLSSLQQTNEPTGLLWERETIWLGNRPVAQVRTQYYGGLNQDIYYIQTDHLNTPRWITDDAGVRLWSWESDAFGTTLPNEDVDGDSTDFEFNMRFPGQYFDVESGMHYNYFRDYEPGTGRYLESDPIGLDGGINTFGYVFGNPAFNSDPKGLCVSKYSGSLIDSDWRVLNFYVENTWYSEVNDETRLIIYFSGNVSVTGTFSCSKTEVCDDLCQKISRKNKSWKAYERYDGPKIFVEYLTPRAIYPTPTWAYKLFKLYRNGKKLDAFNNKANEYTERFLRSRALQICKSQEY